MSIAKPCLLRRYLRATIVLALFFSTGVIIPTSPAMGDRPERLMAGTARIDITPPVPYRMSGYFHERLSTGIHDRLQAKALVLRQGDQKAALVFCDIIGISAQVSDRARSLAQERTGIPAENIAIIATHSHTGPLYFGALRNHFHKKAVAATGEDIHEQVDYPSELTDRLVRAITQADAALEPVTLASGVAQQTTLSFNRRFHMKDGTVRFNPGYMNPNIVRVAGPIDPEVGIVLLRGASEDRPTVSLVSFALHLDTTGGTEYSADYPYYLARALRAALGESSVSLFGSGACGDLNHIDITSRERRRPEEIGRTLAAAVIEALPTLQARPQPSLDVRRGVVHVPMQRFSEEEIAKARATMENVADRKVPFLERVKAYKIMALELRPGDTLLVEVQVFRLSDQTAIVVLPGEVFVDLGLAIKKASPFETTLVIELANDAPGYLPTKKAFEEGSYETVNSRIAPGGGEATVELTIRLLRELKSD